MRNNFWISIIIIFGLSKVVLAQKTIHPTQNILSNKAILNTINRDDEKLTNKEVNINLSMLAHDFMNAREEFRLGLIEGKDYEMFGLIADVDIGSNGDIFVLDARYNDVRVYNTKGDFIQSFGGAGQGPTEFIEAQALSIANDTGLIYVADRHAKIKIFRTIGGKYELRKILELEYAPEDLCIMEGEIYVQGINFSDEHIIHVYDMSGNITRSFGELYNSSNPVVKYSLSAGPVACLSNYILHQSTNMPYIDVYNIDGILHGVIKFNDFHPMNIIEEDTSITFDPGEVFDLMSQVTPIGSNYFLVQISRTTKKTREEHKEYETIYTYIVSATTWEGIYIGTRLPRILKIDDDRLYAAINSPFPQLIIYKLDQ